MKEAFERLAAIPAMNFELLSRKKTLIGPVWVRCYSVFSDAVPRDEAYLKAKAARRRVAQSADGNGAQ